jgi:DNA-binding protein YbaB
MTEPNSAHHHVVERLHEHVERARKQLTEARNQVAAFAATTSGIAWGADPSSIVRVALNHDGGAVGLEVHPQWKSRLDGRDLGTLVVAASSAATRALAEGRMELPSQAESHPDSPPRPRSMPVNGTPEDVRSWLRDLLNEAESSMAVLRDRVERAAAEETTGRSASGRVTATARGGALVRVECSLTWLRDATREQLQSDLLQALRAALPGESHRVNGVVRGTGRLGELFDLVSDPIQLMAALGAASPAPSAVRHGTA